MLGGVCVAPGVGLEVDVLRAVSLAVGVRGGARVGESIAADGLGSGWVCVGDGKVLVGEAGD